MFWKHVTWATIISRHGVELCKCLGHAHNCVLPVLLEHLRILNGKYVLLFSLLSTLLIVITYAINSNTLLVSQYFHPQTRTTSLQLLTLGNSLDD